jgi:hypothetical protein
MSVFVAGDEDKRGGVVIVSSANALCVQVFIEETFFMDKSLKLKLLGHIEFTVKGCRCV